MNGEQLRSFHGDAAVKDKYLARVRAHRAADDLVRGKGWENGKGCAIGCTLEAYDHSRYPIELGIPAELAGLEDFFFENLTLEEAMSWPERFLAAVPVGADLRLVRDRFTLWLLTEELAPLKSKHCEDMGGWFRRLVNGENSSRAEGEKIARDARAAWDAWDARNARAARAAWAAWDAWDARDARSAWAARDAWDAWDARDARSAWAARDARAARDAEGAKSITRQSDALLRLMSEAPVTP